jgi:hypothetical protein
MRDRPRGGVFNVRPQHQAKGLRVDPATWRTLHEGATRRARLVHERISGVTKHRPEVALRLYIAQLYRTGIAQFKKMDPKGRL